MTVDLKLVINKEKTHLTDVHKGVAYLGFIIRPKAVSIDPKKVKKFKDRVRELTPRKHGMNVEEMIFRLNPVLIGLSTCPRLTSGFCITSGRSD